MLHLRHSLLPVMLFAVFSCAAQTAPRAIAPSTGTDVLRAMHGRYATTWYSTVSFTEQAEQRMPDGKMKLEKWYEEAKLPGLLRIDVGVPATDTTTKRKTMLFVNGKLYLRVPGKPVQQSAYLNLLLVLGFDVYRQPIEKTVAQLRAEGFDLSRVHTGTWHGRPVYVVGAAPGDLKSKQFWVDARRLLFVRLIDSSPTSGGDHTEAAFSGYRRLDGGWIATVVTMDRNGKLLLHEKYADIRANVKLPDELFDPASLK